MKKINLFKENCEKNHFALKYAIILDDLIHNFIKP